MNRYHDIVIKLLAVYQITGGVFGLIRTGVIISRNMTTSLEVIFMYVTITSLFFLFSILSGYLLIKKTQTGLKYTLVNQSLQVLNFWIAGYAFKYISGIYIGLEINWTDILLFDIELGFSSWKVLFKYEEVYRIIGLNITALMLILLTKWLMQKMNNKVGFDFESEPNT